METNVLKLKDFYVTSDTWFGREHILQIGKDRNQFADVKEMNRHIIKQWNKVVKKDDVVFHLGNFAWDPHTAETVLSQLKGKIYFILGNHDDALIDVFENFKNAVIIEDQILTLPMHDVVLSHYPLRDWGGRESGTLHIHGHSIFNNLTDLSVERRVNICTDHWGFKPIKISTLKDFINEEL
jgi:calcineurin-like phosphoesterase family protein